MNYYIGLYDYIYRAISIKKTTDCLIFYFKIGHKVIFLQFPVYHHVNIFRKCGTAPEAK